MDQNSARCIVRLKGRDASTTGRSVIGVKAKREQGESGMKIRVLLVDDETEFVDVLAERLETRDFDVSKAYSGDEAIARLKEHKIDVVVLDVLMPGKDGVETLREIKALQPIVEVIMLTGNATVESAVEGMKIGAFDYLMKPAETKDLVEKLVRAYKRKAEQEERIRQAEIERIMQRKGWS
jgi:two-component system, OmpR family, response regulator CpxR